MGIAADWLFGALFLGSAYVQLNDPDPIQWVAIYTLGALVCVLPARLRGGAMGAWAVSSICLGWSMWLAPSAMSLSSLSDLTAEMSADQPEIEAAREALGLAIVALWTAGRALRDQWGTRSASPASASG